MKKRGCDKIVNRDILSGIILPPHFSPLPHFTSLTSYPYFLNKYGIEIAGQVWSIISAYIDSIGNTDRTEYFSIEYVYMMNKIGEPIDVNHNYADSLNEDEW